MKQRLSGHLTVRLVVLAAVASGLAVAVFGPALASGKGPGPTANTVYIEGSRSEPLKFVAPQTIVSGEELTIVNKTNPKQVGPHTFALVDPSFEPETAQARKTCFPKNICGAVAKWQGVTGPHSPATKNPAKAGKPGWDTEGTLTKPGDSWFTTKQNSSLTQRVTVSTAEGPTTLHFMCAVHPWMQGSIEVLPAN